LTGIRWKNYLNKNEKGRIVMKYPDFLSEKGTIGLVAPSFGCTFEPYKTCMETAIKRLEDLGYKIDIGPNCTRDDGIGISSSPENCGKELTYYYVSPDNDILISCGGGELMCETLDYVDFYEIMQAKSKWFMGYSDNTNFTFLLNTICDTASIYGYCVGSLGQDKFDPSHQDTMDILTGKKLWVAGYDKFELEAIKDEEHPTASYNLTEKKELRLFSGEAEVGALPQFTGRLTGGCLDCLANLVGTKYDQVGPFNDKYAEDGIVWFLEACDLNLMSTRRALWNLDRAGWFENAKGFIFGRPAAAWKEELMGLNQYTAVTGILGKYKVPIIMDADLGHLPPAMPIISGAMATVSCENGNIKLEYDLS